MEHYLDIETALFTKIKEHETENAVIPRQIGGREVRPGDTLKLYHPGDETEALRVEITAVKPDGEATEKLQITFALLEWMCQVETELDEMLKEEEMWLL
ncbi:MAG TPA: hypothetical protein H9880_11475 [Candidatus Anaerobutyricum avicola]|nr:hypothetical protein [Candidatus Anaerobutyricum avicola]